MTVFIHDKIHFIFQIRTIRTLHQILPEEFEDSKEVIRICKLKKNRQHNGQKKKYKKTNNDLQNIHIKLKME